MATIAQIVDFMNDRKMIWYPQRIVEVSIRDAVQSELKAYAHGYVPDEPDKVYIRHDSQKWVGHYYVWYNSGNKFSGILLLPLSKKGSYLKAIYDVKEVA